MSLKPFFKFVNEVGIDEAGRGGIAGPVFAAAVLLPKGFRHKDLNDSKLLSEKKRSILRAVIEKEALDYAVSFASREEIDTINILNASILAMHRAIEMLKSPPPHLIVDGNRFLPYGQISYDCIVKGDSKYLSIAAASILAKTYRDEYMYSLHEELPHYYWDKNRGYPTKQHRQAIEEHGVSKHHRISFKLLAD
ncbi:ribonuclease HII [Elysia marginata]|uniref:Ribonuclease n=1 Tax=Elysia marginata TaxID=1093978 RepID=A0AAV4GZX6_9GAST|nr:ribonuclease HII [Elysia marginata]